MILIVWIVVASAASSSAGSDQLCQISLDCTQPLSADVVRCLEPFRRHWMVPLIRPGTSITNGKHLPDLYVNSTDDPSCGTLGVVAEVAENGTVAVNLVVGCRSFASLPMFTLGYATDNRSALMPCGRSMACRLTVPLWDCRITRRELLRPYEEDCIETRLYFDRYNGTMSVKMLLSCWNTTISVYFNFYMKSLAKDRCIDRESTFAGMAHTCNYHRSEQLRLTMIDNNTLMVEDLSTAVPPRSRMILTNRNSSFDHQKKPCNCRNLHRDQKHFDRCMDYLIKVHSNKAEIQREKERASRDFMIALAIVIASFLGNLIARWWVFWKFPDCEFVTRVVYVANNVIMDIECGKTNVNPMYHVEHINSTIEMCFRKFKIYSDMAQICHYHIREHLRFTVLDNDTVLVEDLSPMAPLGTRMFFRARPEEGIGDDQCPCRNVLRDDEFYKKCSKFRDRVQAEYEAESWFKEELEGSTVEDRWIAVGLLLSACLATGLGLLWANGKPRQLSETLFNYFYNYYKSIDCYKSTTI
ncbi:hypothetical protein pipiens_001093 [Culex pipiens pipiens]|uniref:Uncharacterized protein n=1 Tax=Culex pipiens pipiens TaxID=38569 RepID=A0ABD1CL87_CULPP